MNVSVLKRTVFYLNYRKFFIKSYVLDVHPKHTILWRNISATNGPILTKFYLNHHWGGGKAALVLDEFKFRPDTDLTCLLT